MWTHENRPKITVITEIPERLPDDERALVGLVSQRRAAAASGEPTCAR